MTCVQFVAGYTTNLGLCVGKDVRLPMSNLKMLSSGLARVQTGLEAVF